MPVLPELILAGAALALLMLGVFCGDAAARALSWLTVLALIAAGIALSSVAGGRIVTFSGQVVVDGFAVFMKWLVLLGSALTLLMSLAYNERERMARAEYPVLVMFATLGMFLMVSANDLILLYVGLELQSLALYIVAAFDRDAPRSSEAGLKYFVLGALSSGMLLYGASLVYGFAGSTGFDALAALFRRMGEGGVPVGVIIGLTFIIAGLAFKISAVPFHMWTPDVYEGAPTPITAFFSVAPKIAAMALFIRVLFGPFASLAGDWQQVVIAISVASMALGAVAAIWQTNIKRMLAYSSIGHAGYALIGVAANSESGVRGVLIYMAIYLAMSVGSFCVVLAMRRGGRMIEGIDDLAGLARSQPLLAFAMTLLMFSMAGIPPLAGFFSKLYIFLAAIDAKLYSLAVIGVLTSVVGAYYYLRIVKVMYFDSSTEVFDRPLDRDVATILAGTALFVTLFIVYPAPVVDGAGTAARVLFGS
jgi:NADH-quinone oxidoreductase subunit N